MKGELTIKIINDQETAVRVNLRDVNFNGKCHIIDSILKALCDEDEAEKSMILLAVTMKFKEEIKNES